MSWVALGVASALWVALLLAGLLLVRSWEPDYDLSGLEDRLGVARSPAGA